MTAPKLMIPHNLPVQLTPFIGRADELSALEEYLAAANGRLVTIIGPGGVGKTRLAIACGERLVAGVADNSADLALAQGVFFVPLAPLHEPEQLITALAEALSFPLQAGERDGRSPEQQLLDYLRDKQLLLILDNFEHLLGGAALVQAILHTAVAVKIVATSRERLHLPEEQVYPIHGLAFPDWETPPDALVYTAVQLFIQSAQRNDPQFIVVPADLPHLIRICRLVQGMPLGIELAASWVDVLTLPEIAAEIQQSLDFLETDNRQQTDRHRSMRAVFDYSWHLLTADEQALLPQLAVFRGGFSRDAAQTVTQASLRALARLVNKSLLQFDKANGRYQMHELLRQYGREKLAANSAVETAVYRRHSRYYMQLLADREARLAGADCAAAAGEIESAIDNIRAAWRWLLQQHDAATLLTAVNGLGFYLLVHYQHQIGFELYQQARQAFTPPQTLVEKQLWVRAVNWHTFLLFDLTVGNKASAPDLAQALAYLDELQAAGTAVNLDRAFTCYLLGASLSPGVQYTDESIRYVQQAQRLFQAANFAWGTAQTSGWLSWSIFFRENSGEGYLQAREMDAESLRLAQSTGNHWLIQLVLINMCMRAIQAGELEFVVPYLADLEKEVDRLRADRYRAQLAEYLRFYAPFLLHSGSPEKAYQAFADALAIYQELGQPVDEFFVLNLGSFLLHCGAYAAADGYLQQGMALAQARENSWGIRYGKILTSMRLLADGRILEAEKALADFLAATEQALTLIPGDIAGVKANLAWALCCQERWAEAIPLLQHSLQIAVSGRYFLPYIELLPGLILTLAHQGQTGRAMELYGMLLARPYYAQSHLFQAMSGRRLQALADGLPPVQAAPAMRRGRDLDIWSTADALLGELAALGGGAAGAAVVQETAVFETPALPDPTPMPVAARPLPASQPSGRFRQEELLATGGHGEVYRGRDTTTGQPVVIKRLKPELVANQPELVERFLREADVLRQLDHPNIVKMLATQETDDGQIIVMEYVPGGSLGDLLKRQGALPLAQTLDIALELADALARAHHLGVVHRDIKPANVLLAADGTPRLTDFGVASLTRSDKRLTQTGMILGTVDYLSPEACEGQPLDTRSDIWSFGAMLYELLVGEPPFAAESLLFTLMAILTRPTPNVLEKRPSTPPALKTLIDHMLVKEPGQRSSSMRRIAADLEEIRRQFLPIEN